MTAAQRLRCLNCTYDVTGLMHRPCPECGLYVDDRTERVMLDRAACMAGAGRLWRNAAIGAVAAIGVCSTGVLILAGGPGAMLAAGFVLAALSAGSVAAGGLGAMLTQDRHLFATVWLRSLWWLHLPWLVIPACTVLVTLIGLFAKVLGGDAAATAAVLIASMFGLVCWIALVLLSFGNWASRWGADIRRFDLKPGRAVALATVLGIAVLVGAAGVGFVGGVVGGVGAAELFGPVMFD